MFNVRILAVESNNNRLNKKYKIIYNYLKLAFGKSPPPTHYPSIYMAKS